MEIEIHVTYSLNYYYFSSFYSILFSRCQLYNLIIIFFKLIKLCNSIISFFK